MTTSYRAILRKKAAFTQEQLASRVAISPALLSLWEAGKRSLPAATVAKIARLVHSEITLCPLDLRIAEVEEALRENRNVERLEQLESLDRQLDSAANGDGSELVYKQLVRMVADTDTRSEHAANRILARVHFLLQSVEGQRREQLLRLAHEWAGWWVRNIRRPKPPRHQEG